MLHYKKTIRYRKNRKKGNEKSTCDTSKYEVNKGLEILDRKMKVLVYHGTRGLTVAVDD